MEQAQTDKVYVIVFWATWCQPCRQAVPYINALHEKFKNQDVIVIGVATVDWRQRVADIEQYWQGRKYEMT